MSLDAANAASARAFRRRLESKRLSSRQVDVMVDRYRGKWDKERYKARVLFHALPEEVELSEGELDVLERRFETRLRPDGELRKAGVKGISPKAFSSAAYERELHRKVVKPLQDSWRAKLRHVNSVGDAIDEIDAFKVPKNFDGKTGAAARKHFRQVQRRHKSMFIRDFQAGLAVDVSGILNEGPMRAAMQARIAENVSLIKTIPKRFNDDLKRKIHGAFREAAFDKQKLASVVRSNFGSTGFNLRRITRDQTNKAVGQFTEIRHKQIGIERYVWESSGDERVRPSHRALSGRKFSYDDPPAEGNPGIAVMCRCVAIPVLGEERVSRIRQESRARSPLFVPRAPKSPTSYEALPKSFFEVSPFAQQEAIAEYRRAAALAHKWPEFIGSNAKYLDSLRTGENVFVEATRDFTVWIRSNKFIGKKKGDGFITYNQRASLYPKLVNKEGFVEVHVPKGSQVGIVRNKKGANEFVFGFGDMEIREVRRGKQYVVDFVPEGRPASISKPGKPASIPKPLKAIEQLEQDYQYEIFKAGYLEQENVPEHIARKIGKPRLDVLRKKLADSGVSEQRLNALAGEADYISLGRAESSNRWLFWRTAKHELGLDVPYTIDDNHLSFHKGVIQGWRKQQERLVRLYSDEAWSIDGAIGKKPLMRFGKVYKEGESPNFGRGPEYNSGAYKVDTKDVKKAVYRDMNDYQGGAGPCAIHGMWRAAGGGYKKDIIGRLRKLGFTADDIKAVPDWATADILKPLGFQKTSTFDGLKVADVAAWQKANDLKGDIHIVGYVFDGNTGKKIRHVTNVRNGEVIDYFDTRSYVVDGVYLEPGMPVPGPTSDWTSELVRARLVDKVDENIKARDFQFFDVFSYEAYRTPPNVGLKTPRGPPAPKTKAPSKGDSFVSASDDDKANMIRAWKAREKYVRKEPEYLGTMDDFFDMVEEGEEIYVASKEARKVWVKADHLEDLGVGKIDEFYYSPRITEDLAELTLPKGTPTAIVQRGDNVYVLTKPLTVKLKDEVTPYNYTAEVLTGKYLGPNAPDKSYLLSEGAEYESFKSQLDDRLRNIAKEKEYVGIERELTDADFVPSTRERKAWMRPGEYDKVGTKFEIDGFEYSPDFHDFTIEVTLPKGTPIAIMSNPKTGGVGVWIKPQEIVLTEQVGRGSFLAELASKPTPRKKTLIDAGELKKVGNQTGSNEGGLFESAKGERWYVKKPQSEAHARNEVLAAKLYEEAGVKVASVDEAKWVDGEPGVASRIIDDLEQSKPGDLAGMKDVREGFAVDAWLANWDVVGLEYDNLLRKGSSAYRIDTGGALLFRAMGDVKGKAFGRNVGELETFRDEAMNAQSSGVFSKVKDSDIQKGVEKIASISNERIRQMAREFGPAEYADELAETLIARKRFLTNRYLGEDVYEDPLPAGFAVKPRPDAPVKLETDFDSEYMSVEARQYKRLKVDKEPYDVTIAERYKETVDEFDYSYERAFMDGYGATDYMTVREAAIKGNLTKEVEDMIGELRGMATTATEDLVLLRTITLDDLSELDELDELLVPASTTLSPRFARNWMDEDKKNVVLEIRTPKEVRRVVANAEEFEHTLLDGQPFQMIRYITDKKTIKRRLGDNDHGVSADAIVVLEALVPDKGLKKGIASVLDFFSSLS